MTHLNVHAQIAIARVLHEYRAALVRYSAGETPALPVSQAGKLVRAQARATAKIADDEPEALRGLVATVELLLARSEELREGNQIHEADEAARRALQALEVVEAAVLGQ